MGHLNPISKKITENKKKLNLCAIFTKSYIKKVIFYYRQELLLWESINKDKKIQDQLKRATTI